MAGLPAALRDHALRLPHRLRLVESEQGSWEDYTGIRISYDLPGLVLADSEAEWTAPDAVAAIERYRILHLHVLVHFLILDRVADGDVAPDPVLDELSGHFRAAAVALLDTVAEGRGASIFEACHAAWLCALIEEKRAIAQGRLALRSYGEIIRGKNRYLSLASRTFLDGRPGDSTSFLLLIDGMMTALQCRSDAVCHQEDRAHFGRSFPDLLGCSAGELYGAATVCMRKLHEHARSCGFGNLAEGIAECLSQRFPIALEKGVLENHRASILIALSVFPPLAGLA